jgi:hypothetical protein
MRNPLTSCPLDPPPPPHFGCGSAVARSSFVSFTFPSPPSITDLELTRHPEGRIFSRTATAPPPIPPSRYAPPTNKSSGASTIRCDLSSPLLSFSTTSLDSGTSCPQIQPCHTWSHHLHQQVDMSSEDRNESILPCGRQRFSCWLAVGESGRIRRDSKKGSRRKTRTRTNQSISPPMR